jgi:esterase/lipase
LINDVFTVLVYIYKNNETPIKSLYIQGHSMGGGIAIIIGDILSYARSNSIIFNQNKDLFINRIIPTFRGLILLAPLIEFNNYKLLDIFTKFSIILPANISIPTFIFDENKYCDKIWKHKKYREYIELDSNLYNKNKLGYSNNIKFGTLITLYNLTKLVKKIIKDIRYPFIVLYDNNKDIIISKNSIDILMEHSKSIDKKYINIIDGLHDPLANETDVVIFNILEWIKNK